MSKGYLAAVAALLVFVGYSLATSSEYDAAADELELAYINAHSSQSGYAVDCKHKEIESKNWILCESSPVKNAGLWLVTKDGDGYEYSAANGKALSTLDRFDDAKYAPYLGWDSAEDVIAQF